MRQTSILCTLSLCLLLNACSDDKKAKEQAQIEAMLAQHCQKTAQMTQEAYIKKYMLHNGTTDVDRKAAIADYQHCLTQQK